MRVEIVLLVGVATCTSACGRGMSPTSPTDASPVADLRIAGPASVLTGQRATYTARATLAIGVTVDASGPSWDVSDGRIATIDSEGVLTGHSPGAVTISAAYRGAVAMTTVTVHLRPQSRPPPARAHLVIAYLPDPAPASLTRCPDPDRATPAWRYRLTIAETGGVGFTVHVHSWTLFNESGIEVYHLPEHEEEYLAPNSVHEEDVCHSLLGQTSGTARDVIEGVDDNGTRLQFANQLRLLPVSSTPLTGGTNAPGQLAWLMSPRPDSSWTSRSRR